MRVAEYSRDCLRRAARRDRHRLRAAHPGHAAAVPHPGAARCGRSATSPCCDECGVPYELLDRSRLARVEPALARTGELLAGGLRLPNDETGDCHLFTQGLAAIARGLGVEFRFDQPVDGLVTRRRPDHRRAPTGAASECKRRPLRAGLRQLFARLLRAARARPAGLSGQGLFADRAAGRAGAGAAVDGARRDLQGRGHALRRPHPGRRHGRTRRLRPAPEPAPARDAGAWSSTTCSPVRRPAARQLLDRPAADDARRHARSSAPTRYGNLFLNTGHGTLGWTMACGSGRLVADQVTGRGPEIRTDGLGRRALSRPAVPQRHRAATWERPAGVPA